MKHDLPVILALDTSDMSKAEEILDEIGGSLKFLKIGHRLFAQGGKNFIDSLIRRDFNVFLDLKLHDIPNTVRIALEEYLDMGIWAITLHTSGGRKMLEYASETRDKMKSSAYLLGVTVLTSHDEESWGEVNPGGDLAGSLASRTSLCLQTGLDGLVCSPLDLPLVSRSGGKDLKKVVPGIRLEKGNDDQKRINTPLQAFRSGADYIVVGRPILNAQDKTAVIRNIAGQVEEGLK